MFYSKWDIYWNNHYTSFKFKRAKDDDFCKSKLKKKRNVKPVPHTDDPDILFIKIASL